ncbi:hypothetical protein DYB32_010693, partial [Aphanomyces invadans]
MGITETTHMVNEYRSQRNKTPVGRSSVYTCYQRLCPVVTPLNRQKQGSGDEDSVWAVARFGLAQQFASRLGILKWSDNNVSERPSYLDPTELVPLAIEQIVVWDETHKDVRIGDFGANGRKQQVRFPRNEQGQWDVDGAIAPVRSYLNAKFTQQARFSLGCAVVVNDDGVREGRRCEPFVYTGKWVRTIDEVNNMIRSEIQRVKDLPGNNAPWVTGIRSPGSYSQLLVDHKKAPNPYESLYGTEWERAVMRSAALKTSICVTTLIEHIVHASAAVMADTVYAGDWVFMHDALSQMTCKSTIEWMKDKNYHHRWVLPELGLNDGTRFSGRPVGNSPELMPWDCSLNKD